MGEEGRGVVRWYQTCHNNATQHLWKIIKNAAWHYTRQRLLLRCMSTFVPVHQYTCSVYFVFFRHNLHNDLSVYLLGYLHTEFLTQVASKSCISMQLFGSILNLFDAVAEVWNTSWSCQTKQNVMKWGYRIDKKIFHLLHGVVVFNIRAVGF